MKQVNCGGLLIFIMLVSFGCGTLATTPADDYRVGSDGAALLIGKVSQHASEKWHSASVSLRNIQTGHAFTILLKKGGDVGNVNYICVRMPPGEYELVSYYYDTFRGYGILADAGNRQKIVKAESAEALNTYLENGGLERDEDNYPKYRITLAPNQVTYVGSWNLQEMLPGFKDELTQAKVEAQAQCHWIADDSVKVALPR